MRQTAFQIHAYHGHGHLEKVYESTLGHRLRKRGTDVKQQFPIKIFDEDGQVIGDYVSDLLIAGKPPGRAQDRKVLGKEHEAQVLAYLKSTRLAHAMLTNFGSYRFEVRKYVSPFVRQTDVS